MHKRKEIFRALVGSHNYNLNDESSDKDYKVFVAPTFDDLYFGKQYSKSIIGDTEDFDCHDIRKVSDLWWKANVNFLEVLYSEHTESSSTNSTDTKFILSAIFRNKDRIVRMNLPYLYKASLGMHITKKKQIDKGTSGTQHLVDKFGYDTKQAMHSFRILDFIKRFADSDFKDFKGSIRYENDDPMRNLLLGIKNGLFSKEQFMALCNNYFDEIESKYKPLYLEQKTDDECKEILINNVKKIVHNEL